jgi:hypothetical protein
MKTNILEFPLIKENISNVCTIVGDLQYITHCQISMIQYILPIELGISMVCITMKKTK